MRLKPKLTLFNVFYSTTFSLLFFLLFILLVITPADAIHQTLKQSRPIYKIITIASCYFLTLIAALAIYGSRLYTVRTLMGDIPREYVPIKKLDLPKRVYWRIRAGLGRSAVIAYESRPKPAMRPGNADGLGTAEVVGDERRGRSEEVRRQGELRQTQLRAVWGKINHNGWSPSDSEDLPNVEYAAIIKGLPNLIEKKALSVASQRHHARGHLGDFQGMEESKHLLARMPKMSLRAYISYLHKLGYVDKGVGEVFVRDYERARFYSADVSGVEEHEFRKLMKVFALLLRGMDELAQEEQRSAFDGPGYSGMHYVPSEGEPEPGPSSGYEYGLGDEIHRIFTESTRRSDSSAEFPRRQRQDFEMEFMVSTSGIRQRPSFLTFD